MGFLVFLPLLLAVPARAGELEGLKTLPFPAFFSVKKPVIAPTLCWRRQAKGLGAELDVPERICLAEVRVEGDGQDKKLVIAGAPISGTFPLQRTPLLDSYVGWKQAWQAEIFTRAKNDVEGYRTATARLRVLVLTDKKGRLKAPPELYGDVDVEYVMSKCDVSRWSLTLALAPER